MVLGKCPAQWLARPDRHARTGEPARRPTARRPSAGRRLRRACRAAPERASVTIRVLLADDQAMVRAGFRLILESEDDIEVVGEADDGDIAIAAAQRLHPDVALMDIQMPRTDGIEATRQLSANHDLATRVVILTTFERDEYVFEAIRAG